MAWRCGNCGARASRGSVSFDDKGKRVRERCQNCAPEEFDSAFRNPSDNKIYSGPEAMPHMYKRDSNDVFQAKDELLADTAAEWDKGPTERARVHKEATRRTAPLTPAEIEASRRWSEEVLKPALENGGIGAVVAALNPDE
jgi:hypothetical protein